MVLHPFFDDDILSLLFYCNFICCCHNHHFDVSFYFLSTQFDSTTPNLFDSTTHTKLSLPLTKVCVFGPNARPSMSMHACMHPLISYKLLLP